MSEIALGPGRSAESLLLWSAALLLHAAALWLLHASLRATTRPAVPPSRVTVQLLPASAVAKPTTPSLTPPVATPRRTGRPPPADRAGETSITPPALVDPAIGVAPRPQSPGSDAPVPLELQRSTRDAIRETERQSRGLVQAPRPAEAAPESETALGREIARATRPDCQDAYAGAGLLAIPLMLYEAAGGKGTNCRWR